MREYDLYVPLNYDDGTPIEADRLRALKDRLVGEFGGLTFFPQRNEGFWKLDDVTFRDEIVIFRVLTSERTRARRFFRALKEELKRDLRQEEILIVEKTAEVL